MKVRTAWTIAAIALVIVFFGTRWYVGQMIDSELEQPERRQAETVQPRPKPAVERAPPADPLGSARPHVEALRGAAAAETPTADTWKAGEDALQALLAIELEEWTPRMHIRTLDQLAEAAEDLDESSSPEAAALREKVERAYIQLRTTPVQGSAALDMDASIPKRGEDAPTE
jgi:hypothetical protein